MANVSDTPDSRTDRVPDDLQTRAEIEDAIYDEHMAEQWDEYRSQSSPSPFGGS